MKRLLPLILIIVAGFIVRSIGINYGLPFAYHDDEPILVNYALAYGSGDFNPHTFRMSPFLSYTLFFFYGLFFVIGKVCGYFNNIKDFAYLYLNNPTIFYLIGRIVFGLLFGSGSVILVYLIGKRYFNCAIGLVSALFFALNYLHVRDSHYLYFDIPLVFCVLLFFIKGHKFFKPTNCFDYIQIGVLFSLAFSIKYQGAILIFPLGVLIIYNFLISKNKKLSIKIVDLFWCCFSIVLIAFICNPYLFLKFKEFFKDAANLPYIPVYFWFHLNISLSEGCGFAAIIMGLLGMIRTIVLVRIQRLILVAYALIYYLIIAKASQPAERLVLPIIPIILLFTSYFIIELYQKIKNRTIANIFLIIITVVCMCPSLIRIYYSDRLFLKEDTRTQAYNWVKDNIAQNTRIALDATTSWFPKLEKNKEQIKESAGYFEKTIFQKPQGADEVKLKFMLDNPGYSKKTYYIFYLREDTGSGFLSIYPALPINYAALSREKMGYVVLSQILFDKKYTNLLRQLENNSTLIREFSPYKKNVLRIKPKELTTVPAAGFMYQELRDRLSFGPFIRIYKLNE